VECPTTTPPRATIPSSILRMTASSSKNHHRDLRQAAGIKFRSFTSEGLTRTPQLRDMYTENYKAPSAWWFVRPSGATHTHLVNIVLLRPNGANHVSPGQPPRVTVHRQNQAL
jgi:hypothetical protein